MPLDQPPGGAPAAPEPKERDLPAQEERSEVTHLLEQVDYEFLEPWDNGRCVVRIGDRIMEARHFYVGTQRWFVGKIGGVDTQPHRRFLSLLRAVAKQ